MHPGMMAMSEVHLPADYAIDGLSLEASRRAKKLGRPYSYGQLIADTTEAEREQIVERYRAEATAARKKGSYRVNSGYLRPERSARETEDSVCQKLEAVSDEEEAGQ